MLKPNKGRRVIHIYFPSLKMVGFSREETYRSRMELMENPRKSEEHAHVNRGLLIALEVSVHSPVIAKKRAENLINGKRKMYGPLDTNAKT